MINDCIVRCTVPSFDTLYRRRWKISVAYSSTSVILYIILPIEVANRFSSNGRLGLVKGRYRFGFSEDLPERATL